MYSLYPNTQPFEFENPHLASVSIPEIGKRLFLISDLCHTGPAACNMELSMDAELFSINPSEMNLCPITLMMLLIGRIWNRLSMVRLPGIWCILQTLSSLSLLHLIERK